MLRRISTVVAAFAAFVTGAQPSVEPPTVAQRAQFYQRIASLSSTDELESLAREAVASDDPGQRQQLDLILDRYFELDATRAVAFAAEVLRGREIARAALYFERLARADVNGALSVLSQLDDAAQARVAALSVFRGLASGQRARELVAASLQGAARSEFLANTLSLLAEISPSAAFAEALALPDPRIALPPIVARWALIAPRDAVEAVDRVQDPELRALLRSTVLRGWQDLGTLSDYIAVLDPESLRTALVRGDLERVIAEDPQRVAAAAIGLPEGNERRMLLMRIATSYARIDADGALAWVRTLENPDPQLLAFVVRGIAAQDPLRAFDVAASLEEPARSQAYDTALSVPLNDERQFATLAGRIGELPEDRSRTGLLVSLVGSWASRPNNAARTLDWMLSSANELPAELFERVGYIYAQQNPAGAAASIDRLPRAARSAWVMAVTAVYAQTDLQNAESFLQRFRGDPAYDRAAIVLTQQLALADPPAAARLLSSVGTRGPEGPTPEITVARFWAARDPVAAMTWALDLPAMTRNMVMQITATSLEQQDTAALESWALGLPAREKRDAARGAVLRARGARPLNAALLGAFSDDRLRQSALMSTVLATARVDVAEARRLIDAQITDPRMRTQAEQVVDGIARGDPAFPTGGGGLPTGVVGGPTFIGSYPPGMIPPGAVPGAGPVMGPNGQPIMLRPVPQGQMVIPGAPVLPPGAIVMPGPPPAVQGQRE